METAAPDNLIREHVALARRRLHYFLARYGDLDRDDVESAVMLAVLRASEDFDPARSSFSTWLTWKARSLLDAERRRMRAAVRSLPGCPVPITPGLALADPRTAVDAEEPVPEVNVGELLAALDPQEREVIETAFFRPRGASATLGISKSLFSYRKLATLAKLRRMISRPS